MRRAMAIALPQADIERIGIAHMGRLLSGSTLRVHAPGPRSGPALRAHAPGPRSRPTLRVPLVVSLSGGSIWARSAASSRIGPEAQLESASIARPHKAKSASPRTKPARG